jgi:hypothetical protein
LRRIYDRFGLKEVVDEPDVDVDVDDAADLREPVGV